MTPAVALARLHVRLTRRSGIGWTVLVAAVAISTVTGYRAAYPTQAERARLAAQIGSNVGFQALYGRAFDLTTIGGFTAWRLGGLMVVIVMLWGMFTTVRLTRTEEQERRTDLVAAGTVSKRRILAGAIGVTTAWQIINAIVLWVGLLATGLPVGGAVVLSVQVLLCGLVGVAVGAAAAQIWPTRARATGRAGLFVGVAFLIRVIADGSAQLGWLRWATPFGWAEEARAFTSQQRGWPLLLLAAAGAIGVVCAARLVARRDVGGAFRRDSDTGPPASERLRSLLALEGRLTARSVLGWLAAVGVVGAVAGLLASDIAAFARNSPGYAKVTAKLGIADPGRPAAFIGLMFSIVAVVIALYAGRTASAAADVETDGLLDHLVVQPVRRSRWLVTHACTSLVAVATVATTAGVGAWLGAVAKGDSVAFWDAIGAGLNLVPLALAVLGLGTLVHGLWPRAVNSVVIVIVAGGYVWNLVAELVRAPAWVRDVSPFQHVAPFPATAARPVALIALALVGLVAVGVGAILIDRRDVHSG